MQTTITEVKKRRKGRRKRRKRRKIKTKEEEVELRNNGDKLKTAERFSLPFDD